ncbi:hypothetical protein IE53DRAFT_362278 [Violaceomyces palustris]|uniref:Uncharacterized protein n=1 Tax=Violaceomyces palustris TaxID=1673888 RepID=A0ACD0NXL6_9BASI|nr:hypothetical protein IE53DRAFT_362278 [Violaceomyces palustris]
MVELDSLPTYDPSNLSAPSYTQATAAPFPPTPCTLNVKNESKSRLPILFYHPDDEDERIIFEITPSHADETRSSSTGSSPSSGRSSPTPDFRSVVHVNVASESRSAYAVRRHVPSGTYEIVELGDDGSPAKCRKMVTRGIFKSKFAFEGLDGNEWAWKGSAGRSCELYEYQASGKKSLIADYVKSAVGSSTISFKVSPSEPALAIASLFPLIDMHRLELQSSYTTDEQLAQLQREVKPSAWDAYFLSAGQGTAKQEKFKLQLARERERSRSASRNRAVADGEPGEVGPAPVLFHPPTFNGTAGLVGRIEEDGERGRGRTK